MSTISCSFHFDFTHALVIKGLGRSVPFRISRTQTTANMPADGLTSIPTLEQKHNGVPARLLHKARRAKSLIQDIATKPVRPRQRLPVIPQGIERSRFFRAIDELAKELGDENIEVNDKPLDDGW